jgi:hypothetical protein
MVGNPGVEPGSSWSQARRVTVSLAPGGEGRNRTGSAALAGRARCLTCHPQGRRVPDNPVKKDGTRRHRGRPGCLPVWCSRYGGFNCRACYEARRDGRNRTRTRGFGDRCSAVKLRPWGMKRANKNRPSGVPESGSCQSPYWRYTGTCPLPEAYDMPSPVGIIARLGCDHG